MKKICILLISFVFLLAACDDNIYYWDFLHDVDYVEEIMIVEMLDENDYTIIKEIDIERAEEFYSDIKALKMKKYGTNLSSPSGLCFAVVFQTGEYDIISKKEPKHYRYTNNDVLPYNSWLCCEETEFDVLINKYL